MAVNPAAATLEAHLAQASPEHQVVLLVLVLVAAHELDKSFGGLMQAALVAKATDHLSVERFRSMEAGAVVVAGLQALVLIRPEIMALVVLV
jgi:hypothetical protein